MIVFTESDDALARQLLWVIRNAARACHADGAMLPSPLSDLYEALSKWVGEPRADWSGPERTKTDSIEETDDDRLMTYNEVAHQLNVCERTVRRYAATGELTTVKVGRSRRIRPADLERFVDER